MTENDPDTAIQLSSIQHLLFCPRQCYLAHVEQQWEDNGFTVSGTIMHERVDSQESEYIAPGVKQVRSLELRSLRYGVSGRADLIEFDENTGRIYPVEYKIGKPKSDDCDSIQLCAQALCLEEMLSVSIQTGALYYGKTRRRLEIEFTESLRKETISAIERVHAMFSEKKAPLPVYSPEKCGACSLKNLCLPELSSAEVPSKWFGVQLELP